MHYLTVEDVVQINADLLDGEHQLSDPGLLASAVGRPSQTVFGEEAYPTVFGKAAALFESLCLNHAFYNGNKRTAVVAVMHFLMWNGLLLASDNGAFESYEIVNLAIDVIEHKMAMPRLEEWFKAHAWPIDFSALEAEDE